MASSGGGDDGDDGGGGDGGDVDEVGWLHIFLAGCSVWCGVVWLEVEQRWGARARQAARPSPWRTGAAERDALQ